MARPTKTKVSIRSTDCGTGRRIQNHRFFDYFEQGRLQHLRELAVVTVQRPTGTQLRTLTVVEASALFIAPGHYPSGCIILTQTGEVLNQGFDLEYTVLEEDTGMILAEGASTQVWLDIAGKPAPLPERIREALVNSKNDVTRIHPLRNYKETMEPNSKVTETPIAVRLADLDIDDIVNNASYFIFFEHGRLHHLRDLGALPRGLSAREIALSFTVEETTARYLSPVRYPDELIVQTRTKGLGKFSFSFEYLVYRTADEKRVAEGTSYHRWLDESGRSTELPDRVRLTLTDDSWNSFQ